MAEGKFILPGGHTVSMSAEDAEKLITCGSGDAALLYLCILSGHGIFSREEAALKIHRTEKQIDAAMNVLASLGLVRQENTPLPEPADELPQYTAEDITRELDRSSTFKTLVFEVQNILGKILSSNDLSKLFGIYDHLGLPAEVILVLITSCVEDIARKSGPGRKPTMLYIEKVAYSWEREGIFSLDAAEEYLRNKVTMDNLTSGAAAALQLHGRALTASERRYIQEWLTMGFEPDAMAEAYDRTVLQTGKLSWNYMNKILLSWNAKGLHKLAEIKSGDRRPAKNPARQTSEARGGPTADDVAKMRNVRDKLKGDR